MEEGSTFDCLVRTGKIESLRSPDTGFISASTHIHFIEQKVVRRFLEKDIIKGKKYAIWALFFFIVFFASFFAGNSILIFSCFRSIQALYS